MNIKRKEGKKERQKEISHCFPFISVYTGHFELPESDLFVLWKW